MLCTKVEDKSRGGGEEEKSRSAISTGGYCPASAVYHLLDGTPSGLQECVVSGARAATRTGCADGGKFDDVEEGLWPSCESRGKPTFREESQP